MKIKIKRSTLRVAKYVGLGLLGVALIGAAVWFLNDRFPTGEQVVAEEGPNPIKEEYGIVYDEREVELQSDQVKQGETLSHLLGRMGFDSAVIDRTARTIAPVFDVSKIKEGNNYTTFYTRVDDADSTAVRRPLHLVYQESLADYLVVSFLRDSIAGDSVAVRKFSKPVETVRRKETAKIESSLWNSMVANDIPAALSVELENIYGWSVNFFHLQAGDEFTVIFDEKSIDGQSIGTGQVWGAVFYHRGKEIYAIPFRQDNKVSYWDEQGNSMKKQFLKAPLKYSRISSGYTTSRLHPIYKVRRAHLGIDYAAPTGTPVMAIADGTVSERRWDRGGGGNILRIKHSNGYVSTYMHLSKYAAGIKVGTHVSQGQKVAEVGSTGGSTGPHLDFRVSRNGTSLNPLNLPSGTVEPIKSANRTAFNVIRDQVMAELKGEVPDSLKLKTI